MVWAFHDTDAPLSSPSVARDGPFQRGEFGVLSMTDRSHEHITWTWMASPVRKLTCFFLRCVRQSVHAIGYCDGSQIEDVHGVLLLLLFP